MRKAYLAVCRARSSLLLITSDTLVTWLQVTTEDKSCAAEGWAKHAVRPPQCVHYDVFSAQWGETFWLTPPVSSCWPCLHITPVSDIELPQITYHWSSMNFDNSYNFYSPCAPPVPWVSLWLTREEYAYLFQPNRCRTRQMCPLVNLRWERMLSQKAALGFYNMLMSTTPAKGPQTMLFQCQICDILLSYCSALHSGFSARDISIRFIKAAPVAQDYWL